MRHCLTTMPITKPIRYGLFLIYVGFHGSCFPQIKDTVRPSYRVTLKEAHIGSLGVDTTLLHSYGSPDGPSKDFYLEARSLFSTKSIDFTDPDIVKAAAKNHLPLMAGPMLGDLKVDGLSIWLRPAQTSPITVRVIADTGGEEKTFTLNPVQAGRVHRIQVHGLSAETPYKYVMLSQGVTIAEGHFQTSSKEETKGRMRVAFGSCFHKIGLHNPNLVNTIVTREPQAMLLLGDLAADDRENNWSMHRSDYLLRDVAKAWKKLAANVPIYASWDDHDYLNNDLSGIPDNFNEEDRNGLRALWRTNWNNPKNNAEGINFHTRLGPVELIMLDTRSCRENKQRGQYGSYLGDKQLSWLKNILRISTAPFKIISSGTMWSDYVSNGKDSWGTWDTRAREEIFALIEAENICGVVLISGDRHGARGFTIPRHSGFELYEFEAAVLGGVKGPDAMAPVDEHQIFGYLGLGLRAFGEFTFDTRGNEPFLTFRLIDEFANILEEHVIPYSALTPKQ
ncbi:MAG: alkaline phosphatase D family protein [Bacteroidota bacterium]